MRRYDTVAFSQPRKNMKTIKITKRIKFERIIIDFFLYQSANTPAIGATTRPGTVESATRKPILAAESLVLADKIPS